MADFFKYKYSGSENITVQEFLDSENTPVVLDVEEFLTYQGDGGEQNLDYITEKYSKIQLNKYQNEISTLSPNLIINAGTTVNLPKDNTVLEDILLYSENQFLSQGNFEAYLGQHEELLQDPKYVRSEAITINADGIDLRLLNESIQVWVWIRSINRIVDITPFVNYCSTSKQSDIGSFIFSLNPTLDIDEVVDMGGDFLNFFPVNDSTKNKHTVDFFEKNLQQNDVVFIRFEQLERDIEGDTTLKNLNTLYRESYHLSPKTWDMIGLIDKASTNYTSNNTDKLIDVSGRDLMKLLVDDGSYFLPYKYIEGKDVDSKFVWGGNVDDNWFKRNFISGGFDTFFSYEMKGIGDSLKFIINHLSNLGVTPNNLWDAYEDRRTTVYDLKGDTTGEVSESQVNGVWQIVKLAIDDNIDNTTGSSRIIAGDGLINPNGTLYEFFNNICQQPFVEFWGDTYTDTFDLIIRQPPFTKTAIQEVWRKSLYIAVEEEDLVGSYNFDFDSTYYTHYQIEPQGEWMGNDTGTFQAIIPIIYLPQYADTFGNKRLYVKDSYLSRVSVFGEGKVDKFNTFIEAILNDYQFLIETTTYLPFTRKGTFTINGDRRIKKGSFIYFKATDEMFHVDGVTNNFSASTRIIDRTTTVTVSRGMKTKSILDGEAIYNYFNIVDANIIKETILNRLSGGENKIKTNIKTNFGVDEQAFDYFLTRKHFN
jgi:hypothetical protein